MKTVGLINKERGSGWGGGLGHHIIDVYSILNCFIDREIYIVDKYVNNRAHSASDDIYGKIIDINIRSAHEKSVDVTEKFTKGNINKHSHICIDFRKYGHLIKSHPRGVRGFLIDYPKKYLNVDNSKVKVNLKIDMKSSMFTRKNNRILIHMRRGDVSILDFNDYEISNKYDFLKDVNITRHKEFKRKERSNNMYNAFTKMIEDIGVDINNCEIILISNGFPYEYVKSKLEKYGVTEKMLYEIRNEFMEKEYSIFNNINGIKMEINECAKNTYNDYMKMMSSYLDSDYVLFASPRHRSLFGRIKQFCTVNGSEYKNFPKEYHVRPR
jgi:hypothetical protein